MKAINILKNQFSEDLLHYQDVNDVDAIKSVEKSMNALSEIEKNINSMVYMIYSENPIMELHANYSDLSESVIKEFADTVITIEELIVGLNEGDISDQNYFWIL